MKGVDCSARIMKTEASTTSKNSAEFSIKSLMQTSKSSERPEFSVIRAPVTSIPQETAMPGLQAANQFLYNLAALTSLQEAFLENVRHGGMTVSPTHPAFAGALSSSLPGFMSAYATTGGLAAVSRQNEMMREQRGHCLVSSPYKRHHPESLHSNAGKYYYDLYIIAMPFSGGK